MAQQRADRKEYFPPLFGGMLPLLAPVQHPVKCKMLATAAVIAKKGQSTANSPKLVFAQSSEHHQSKNM